MEYCAKNMAPQKLRPEDLERLLFQVLQILHHFFNLGGMGDIRLPRSFVLQQQELLDLPKPVQASPYSPVARAYRLLVDTFFGITIQMLRQHYLQRLDDLTAKLQNSGCNLKQIKTHLDKAKSIGRDRFGKKLRPKTIWTFHQFFYYLTPNSQGHQILNYILDQVSRHPTHKQHNTNTHPNTHIQSSKHTTNIQTHKSYSQAVKGKQGFNTHTKQQVNYNQNNFITPKHTAKQSKAPKGTTINTQNRFAPLESTYTAQPLPQRSPRTPRTHKRSKKVSHTPNYKTTQQNSPSSKHRPVPAPGTTHQASQSQGTGNKCSKPTYTPSQVPFAQTSTLQTSQQPTSSSYTSPTKLFGRLSSLPKSTLCDSKLKAEDIKGAQHILSNFHPSAITFNGTKFVSVEQAYQFLKAKFYGAHDVAKQIMSTSNSTDIKIKGNSLNKTYQGRNREWDSKKLNIMRELLLARAQQNITFKNYLLGTYPQPLEHSAPDKFWGTIQLSRQGFEPGQDQFAQTLLQLRYHLAQQQGLISVDTTPISPQSNTSSPSFSPPKVKPVSVRLHNLKPTNLFGTKTYTVISTTTLTTNTTTTTPSLSQPRVVPTSSSRPAPKDEDQSSSDESETTFCNRVKTYAEALNTPPSGTHIDSSFSTPKVTPPNIATRLQFSPIDNTKATINGPNITTYRFAKKDWKVPKTREKLVILGDSNIGRITRTPVGCNSISLHCYPGASFTHFTRSAFFLDNSPITNPTNVIVSVGINHKDLQTSTTLEVNVRKAMAQLKKHFHNSNIAVPLINYSTNLSKVQKGMLEKLNQLISYSASRYGISVIDPIGMALFKTVDDNIHWTEATANSLLAHWYNSLN